MGLFNFFRPAWTIGRNRAKKLQDFQSRGAVILDVRTKSEYDTGAIPGSRHIPLQQVAVKLTEIKKWNKPVITCCESGGRSESAATILRNNGIEAINGGGWLSLSKKL